MQPADLGVIKDIPGYKVILKTVLRCQIQQLVEQLATHTDEESVILTASVSDGTLCHLGSESGKSFLEDHDDVKSQFLGFCLKRQQQKRAESLNDTVQNFTDRFSKHQSYTMPQHPFSQRTPQSRPGGPPSMARGAGIRHDPYPRVRPVRQQSPQTVGRSPVASRMAMALNSDYMKYESNDGSESDEGTTGLEGPQTSTHIASQGSSPRQASTDPHLELKSEIADKSSMSEPAPEIIPKESFDNTSDSQSDYDNKHNFSSLVPSDGHPKEEEDCETPGPSGEPGASDSSSSVKQETCSNPGSDLEAGGAETGPMGSHEMWMPENFGDYPPGATGNLTDYPLEQDYNATMYKAILEQATAQLREYSDVIKSAADGASPKPGGPLKPPIHRKSMFHCQFCGKIFYHRGNFEIHVRIHTGERPYCCEICMLRFARKDRLKFHMISAHKQIPD